MALRRLSPMENPPSASSSSSEDESEEINDKEEDQDQEQNNAHVESEEEEEEEEESDEEEENKKPSVQKPTSTITPLPDSESESEGSDSEIHSGETQPSPTASDFTIKPIVSKPMDDSTKHKKPASKPAAPASKPAKRSAESDQNVKESQKKKIKVSNGDEKDGAVEERKFSFNRLWSEDDEIAILKGMIEYQSKKGAEPHADAGAFHEFIKKSLHVDVSKNQLMDKIRRLKKKYQNNAGKGEKGEDPVFSKSHDHKSFELSKKIWGGVANNAVDDNAKSDIKKSRKSVKVNNSVPSPKEDRKELVLREGVKVEIKDQMVDQKDFWAMYPRLKESLELEESSYLSMSEPGKNFMKERMSMIGSAKAMELEEKWKNLRRDEVALYLKRAELIHEQTKLTLDAMKSSQS